MTLNALCRWFSGPALAPLAIAAVGWACALAVSPGPNADASCTPPMSADAIQSSEIKDGAYNLVMVTTGTRTERRRATGVMHLARNPDSMPNSPQLPMRFPVRGWVDADLAPLGFTHFPYPLQSRDPRSPGLLAWFAIADSTMTLALGVGSQVDAGALLTIHRVRHDTLVGKWTPGGFEPKVSGLFCAWLVPRA